MAERRKFIVISDRTGTDWWQWPDEMWRKWPLLQRIRLRRTMAEQLLPLLGQLEELYLKDTPLCKRMVRLIALPALWAGSSGPAMCGAIGKRC